MLKKYPEKVETHMGRENRFFRKAKRRCVYFLKIIFKNILSPKLLFLKLAHYLNLKK